MTERPETYRPARIALDDDELERVAERAAEKAIVKLTDHIYHEVGKSVISKILYIVGACTVGSYLWLRSKGVF